MAEARRTGAPPGEPRLVGYLYVLPAVLAFGAFLLWPILRTVSLSFYEWDGLTQGTWVGLANYRALLDDPTLRAPSRTRWSSWCSSRSCRCVARAGPGRSAVAGAAAGLGFFRTVLFLPQVVAMVVVGITWSAIYAPTGPLNDTLSALGLDALTTGWLGDPTWALPAVGLVGTWVGTGLCVVLFLAGLSRVPREQYEAARLDGAGPVREFLAVGLPALRGEIAVAVTLTVIAALRTFDLVYVMTSGGPGGRTRVPAYEVYDRAFLKGEVGSAAAMAVVLTLLILAITVGVNRLAERAP